MTYLKQIAKAVAAAVIAGLGALVTVLVGDVGLGDLSDGQWVSVVLTALVAAAGVWGIPNAKPPA